MSRRDGGQLLVDLMRDYQVGAAFGVSSIHNLPLVEALDAAGLYVPVRHEAAAVNAADAYARVTGGLGVAITSTGTGAGNAAGSMVEALTAGSRVLHITGQIESTALGYGLSHIHETPDQIDMLRSVSKRAWTIPSVAAAGPTLRAAVAAALEPPQGPVSVEWPFDLQYATQPEQAFDIVRPAVPALPADASLNRAAELIAAARRPLLWVGGGGRGARAELLELVERLGIPVFTSNAGRGSVREDNSLVIGNFATSPAARALIEDADLLIGVGSHFRASETAQASVPFPARHVQIDVSAEAIGRCYPATVGLVGDAAAVLSALLERLRERPVAVDAHWRERGIATRVGVRETLRGRIGQYTLIMDSLRERFPEDAVFARDVTVPSSAWGNRLLEIYEPHTNVYPLGGGIGQGLGMGIGAAAARPGEPLLIMAGDGGLSVHLGEIASLAEQHPRAVLLVFNDGGYGVLRSLQEAQNSRPSGVDLLTPDFSHIAASVGMEYQLVSKAEEFDKVLARALEFTGPSLLEVDVTSVGPMPAPFVPPLRVPDSK
jgi:acetolactate synthase I/II/III large subunit